jgi:ElaB/YqjD/DUF883 family membrane-anchored ribosome-binding protein
MPADSDTHTLQKEIGQLRSDLATLTASVKSIVAEQGSAAYQSVRHSAHKAREQAAKATDAVGEEISEHPLTSVLGAFGVGLLFGVLLGRRS